MDYNTRMRYTVEFLRVEYHLTKKEICSIMEVDSKKYSEFEKGKTFLSSQQINRLLDKYNYPPTHIENFSKYFENIDHSLIVLNTRYERIADDLEVNRKVMISCGYYPEVFIFELALDVFLRCRLNREEERKRIKNLYDRFFEIVKDDLDDYCIKLYYESKGDLCRIDGKNSEALDYYNKATKYIYSIPSYGINQYRKGRSNASLGNNADALKALNNAEQAFNNNHNFQRVYLCLYYKAVVMMNIREYDYAMRLLTDLLNSIGISQNFMKNSVVECIALCNMFMGNYELAIPQLNYNRIDIVISSWCLYKLGKNEEAINRLHEYNKQLNNEHLPIYEGLSRVLRCLIHDSKESTMEIAFNDCKKSLEEECQYYSNFMYLIVMEYYRKRNDQDKYILLLEEYAGLKIDE